MAGKEGGGGRAEVAAFDNVVSEHVAAFDNVVSNIVIQSERSESKDLRGCFGAKFCPRLKWEILRRMFTPPLRRGSG
jgi:hypothetical protein